MSKRIVLKFGTGILTTDASGLQLDRGQFARLAGEISALVDTGHSVIVISSAAVAAGVAALGRKERPSSLPAKQACAAVGQSQLMRAYEESFAPHKLVAAQLLLSHDDIDSRQRRANAENTLRELLSYPRVVPVINENDSVAVEELGFGDNDQLGAEVASLLHADLYLILTRSDGLHAAHRTGGMGSKLEAVGFATGAGIETWILDGMQPGRIAAALAGEDTGTRFPAGR